VDLAGRGDGFAPDRALSPKELIDMRVLITGAFGNIGSATVAELIRQGHQVRAFDVATPDTQRVAARFQGQIDVHWGDIRAAAAVRNAALDRDVIIHLAAIIPPVSDEQPALAEAVNVGGTRNVIAAARAQPAPPRVFLASSFDVFGNTQHLPPPRRVSDPVAATNGYTQHKIDCEGLIKQSGLSWIICRFCDVPIARDPHPIMYDIPLDTRFEVIHRNDLALAITNVLTCAEAWGQTLLIGGGARCQIRYRDYVFGALTVMGIGPLPEAAFTQQPYCTDWLDTDYSQRLLQYQRHTFDDIVREMTAGLAWRRIAASVLRPIVRRRLLKLSPYWK
jgi:UDP-glucose 4-epimerase